MQQSSEVYTSWKRGWNNHLKNWEKIATLKSGVKFEIDLEGNIFHSCGNNTTLLGQVTQSAGRTYSGICYKNKTSGSTCAHKIQTMIAETLRRLAQKNPETSPLYLKDEYKVFNSFRNELLPKIKQSVKNLADVTYADKYKVAELFRNIDFGNLEKTLGNKLALIDNKYIALTKKSLAPPLQESVVFDVPWKEEGTSEDKDSDNDWEIVEY